MNNPNLTQSDTIAAISTAKGKAALAIIRVSGASTFEIIQKITKTHKNFNSLKYNKMYKAVFHDNQTKIDEGMICLFKSPMSFTGEDMAELYCHGNDFIVSQILESLLQFCRLADKGEFTFRAFLNRKIDLTQAEAIGNLLNAQTRKAQKAALMQLEGRLQKNIKNILDKLTNLRVIFELAIDFVEDEVPEYNNISIKVKVEEVLRDLNTLIDTAHDGIIVQEGIKICLAGAPNVGKSSIFNAFLETERAIVTPVPGTTRDYLEEAFALSGFLIRLFDTAGIHESDDHVEKIGIERSRELIKTADLIFYITTHDTDCKINDYFLSHLPSEKTIKVLNKSDLISKDDYEKWEAEEYVLCSTKSKDGLTNLKSKLVSVFKNVDTEMEAGIITNSRQLACVKKSYESLLQAYDAINNNIGVDFIAFDIQQASSALEEIIGNISYDDILNKIFDNFCIGK